MKDVVYVLSIADNLTSYIDAIRVFAINSLKEGEEVPGYKLVEGRSNRTWNGDFEKDIKPVLISLGLEEDELYTKKPLTAPATEKLRVSFKREKRFQKLIRREIEDYLEAMTA